VFDVFLGLMGDSPLTPAGRVQRAGVDYRRLVGRRTLPGQKVEVRLVFEVYRRGAPVDRIEEVSVVGVVDRSQVHGVLAEAGFSVRREFSDYDFTPYHDGDRLLIVEAMCRQP
jgi:hypothetical protein